MRNAPKFTKEIQPENLEGEIWKPVVGYEGWYEVSNCGRVKRTKGAPATYNGKLLKPVQLSHKQTYLSVCLRMGGKEKWMLIQGLVAAAFLGERGDKIQVNHIDGDKTNNHLSNLEYCTRSENLLHAFKMGLAKPLRGEKHPLSKLTDEDVQEIRRLLSEGVFQRTVAKQFGVAHGLIAYIATGGGWKHLPMLVEIPRRFKKAS